MRDSAIRRLQERGVEHRVRRGNDGSDALIALEDRVAGISAAICSAVSVWLAWHSSAASLRSAKPVISIRCVAACSSGDRSYRLAPGSKIGLMTYTAFGAIPDSANRSTAQRVALPMTMWSGCPVTPCGPKVMTADGRRSASQAAISSTRTSKGWSAMPPSA